MRRQRSRQISKDSKEGERRAVPLSIFPRPLDKYRDFDRRGLLKVIIEAWLLVVRKIMRIDKLTPQMAVRNACENVMRSSARGGGVGLKHSIPRTVEGGQSLYNCLRMR